MAKVLVSEENLQNIAQAIREKTGKEETYKPAEMAQAIEGISGGGSGDFDIKNAVIEEYLAYRDTVEPGEFVELVSNAYISDSLQGSLTEVLDGLRFDNIVHYKDNFYIIACHKETSSSTAVPSYSSYVLLAEYNMIDSSFSVLAQSGSFYYGSYGDVLIKQMDGNQFVAYYTRKNSNQNNGAVYIQSFIVNEDNQGFTLGPALSIGRTQTYQDYNGRTMIKLDAHNLYVWAQASACHVLVQDNICSMVNSSIATIGNQAKGKVIFLNNKFLIGVAATAKTLYWASFIDGVITYGGTKPLPIDITPTSGDALYEIGENTILYRYSYYSTLNGKTAPIYYEIKLETDDTAVTEVTCNGIDSSLTPTFVIDEGSAMFQKISANQVLCVKATTKNINACMIVTKTEDGYEISNEFQIQRVSKPEYWPIDNILILDGVNGKEIFSYDYDNTNKTYTIVDLNTAAEGMKIKPLSLTTNFVGLCKSQATQKQKGEIYRWKR